ncbi:MAG: 2-phosphosulfolactate phosphatase [Polyangiaceae bacterium]
MANLPTVDVAPLLEADAFTSRAGLTLPGARTVSGSLRVNLRQHPTDARLICMRARFLTRRELDGVGGAVVAIDVIRAFTTAAYAFAAGARQIFLVESVPDALAFKESHPGCLAMGHGEGGRRMPGFDFSNSPVEVSRADLAGRTLVQRTGAGTPGVLAAHDADRIWCASLVCASATARAVNASALGTPAYVITGRVLDGPETSGSDDIVVAEFIECARLGLALDAADVARRVSESDEARFTLSLGPEHCHPDDIVYATRVDAFDFAMEVTRSDGHVRLSAVSVR